MILHPDPCMMAQAHFLGNRGSPQSIPGWHGQGLAATPMSPRHKRTMGWWFVASGLLATFAQVWVEIGNSTPF